MVRQQNRDRSLLLRDGVYYYWRRVPKVLVHLGDRVPVIEQSLKTDDLAKARAQRDILEEADNVLWASMLTDGKSEAAMAAYKVARARAEALSSACLAPVYRKTPINQNASVLLWRWPQIKTFIEQAAPGSMFELSINRRSGFVPLAVK